MGVLQTHRWEHTTLNVLKTGDVLGFYKQVLNPSSRCELGGKNESIPFACTRQGTQRSTGEMGKSESNPEALRTRERKNTTEKVFGRAVRCSWQKVLQE